MRTLAPAVWAGLVALATIPACGSSEGGSSAPRALDDAGGTGGREPVPPLAARPLGMTGLADFAYSRGPGRKTFKKAIAAEKHSDWVAAERHARGALSVDSGHLEAHWLLARALAELGKTAEVGAPLVAAVAGDWLRWGPRALEEPSFEAFRAGPQGAQFRERVAQYREQMRRIARDGLWVVGRRGRAWRPRKRGATPINHRAEIYAYDFEQQRYVRVSRTNGAVVGFLRSPASNEAAYVSYRKVWLPTDHELRSGRVAFFRELRIGTVDADGPRMSSKEVVFENVWAVEMSYATSLPGKQGRGVSAAKPALIARVWRVNKRGMPSHKATAYRLDPDTAGSAKIGEPGSKWDTLRVTYTGVSLRRSRVAGVAADWDRDAAAGAFMLADTRKTITLPEGQSASRHTMRWSAHRMRLAFATQPLDACSDDASERAVSLYVADATTGKLREIARGDHYFAPRWIDDARLAYVSWPDGGAPGVRVYDAEAGRELVALDTVGGVGTQWVPAKTACSDAPVDSDLPDDAGDDVDDDGIEWDDDDGLAAPAER